MRVLAGLLTFALVLAACGDDGDDEGATTTSPPTSSTTVATSSTAEGDGTTTTTTTTTARPLPVDELETVATGLEVPWGLAWVDGGTMLVTERPGRVRVVEDGTVRPEPVLTLDPVTRAEDGLLGLALHPDFDEERAAYLYYTAQSGNRVSRFEVADDLTFSNEEVLLDGLPSAQFHDGGRLAFGPDGMLYVTTGDAREPFLAPDLSSRAGKILRLQPDGSVPDDNPFDGSPVYSYGHRNPQGLAWGPDGRLYASEHGPSGDLGLCCHDEINLIEPGGFYGWPYRAGEVEAGGGEQPASAIPPIASSGESTWAPAGLAVAESDDGHALVLATLRGEQLLRFDLTGGDDAPVAPAEVAAEGLGRLRISAVGPDGCLYIATSNRDGRGDAGPQDDQILRSC